MKLFELTGVKHLRSKSSVEVLDYLKSQGFEQLGQGTAGTTFLKDGLVYKFWVHDDSYVRFLEYVQKHQDNKHLPKLKSKPGRMRIFFKRPADEDGEFDPHIYFVKLEHLTEDVPTDVTEALSAFSAKLQKKNKLTVAEFEKDHKLDENMRGLLETVVDINKARKAGDWLDFEKGLNVMQRGATTVAIDGFWNPRSNDVRKRMLALNTYLINKEKQ